jgi:hypothetical protein
LQFRRAIREFEDATADSDIAVVYYSGHGIEIHGISYLIPVDAKLASESDAADETIPLERLIEAVDQAKRLRLVILDACRDNPFARAMLQQRTTATQRVNPGLGAVDATTPNTLIAYAAKACSAVEDGNADHSPFTTALLNNLFVPGLDIRLAFGRVRDEVLNKAGNRQQPFVFGTLGAGSIALVLGPGQPPHAVAEPVAERNDYDMVATIGTKIAWEVFLTRHPTGFYADLARRQIAKLNAVEPRPSLASVEAPKPPPGPATEEQRAQSALPHFPWPPPAASASYVLPRSLLNSQATVGEETDAIIAALERNGYVERSFYGTPAPGVALITRLERINDDGSPASGSVRWPAGQYQSDPANLAQFLRGLFYADPGRYRVIVFIIQGQPFTQDPDKTFSGKQAEELLPSGANVLPPEVAQRPVAESNCTALIYEFANDGTAMRKVESHLTGRQHLEKAGLLAALEKPN